MKKYIIRFSAPGYAVEFQYMISAASLSDAKTIWVDYLVHHLRARELYNRCKKDCCGYIAWDEQEDSPFPEGYCEELEWKQFSLASDHIYD